MKKFDRITPSGTGDLVFSECDASYAIIEKLRTLFFNFGYGEVRTPTIEFFDTFSHGIGKLSQNSLYTLTDSAGRLLVMRPDSTKPIARLYASRLYMRTLPLRIYYTQPVFRRNIELCKKSDEFQQSGIELIGSDSFKADLEVLSLAVNSMYSIFGDDFYLEIGHMGLLRPLLDSIEDEDLKREVKIAIATKNYPDLLKLSKSLDSNAELLNFIPNLLGSSDLLSKAKTIFKGANNQRILDNLQLLCENATKFMSPNNLIVDLAVMNEYDYYTGVVFRAYIKGEGAEILSGGRYNTLYSDYKLNIPAIGFAINIDRASKALLKQQLYKIKKRKLAVIFSSTPGFDNTTIINNLVKGGYTIINSLLDTKEATLLYAKEIGADLIVCPDNDELVKLK
ncbi:MAG: ATP phosphoribosyltransferase regulatory subunit [Christensenellaceae bacterium]|jgi:ATP phosphoribosyltransferase regulatory subunit|nr:ATP phosphoribosyltransferase regulatory subunit [Christensenellaceae bacterium]